ncbi:MAG: hypothetical protein WCE64_08970 [Bacteroidales bacterium]
MKTPSNLILLLLIIIFTTSCVINPYSADTYIYKQKTPYGPRFHALSLDYVNYFTYRYFNKAGTYNELVTGDYEIKGDSLLLSIIKPVEYKIRQTFVKYSDYKSPDSVYFFFYELHPQILKFNRNRYQKASLDLIYDCPKDTCPAMQAIDCKLIPGWAFDDTIVVSRRFYIQDHADTLDFFDPYDELVDKKVPIVVDNHNCVKIYLALKPLYDLMDIPLSYHFKNKKLVSINQNNKNRIYKLRYKGFGKDRVHN